MDVRGGPAEIVYVLLLVQAAAGLLASVGELVLMANPVYVVLPVARAVALFVLAAKIVRGRRWAMLAAIVLQCLGLHGMWLGILLGLLPGLAPSITLVGLLTQVALPVAVIVLCTRLRAAPYSPYAGVCRILSAENTAYARVWRFGGGRQSAGVAR